MTKVKTPPLHPKPQQGLKSPFMPVNEAGTTPDPTLDPAGDALRRQRGGAEKSGGTRNKQ